MISAGANFETIKKDFTVASKKSVKTRRKYVYLRENSSSCCVTTRTFCIAAHRVFPAILQEITISRSIAEKTLRNTVKKVR